MHADNGKLVKVEGDQDFPFNQGRLCPRCLALPEVIYHPDRLRYPLLRVGKRGEGKWQRISWDDALDRTAEAFKEIRTKYGSESVIFCSGTGRDILVYLGRLARVFGSPNRVSFGPLHGQACFLPKVITGNIIQGGFAVTDCAQFFPDRFANKQWKPPQCIIIWGTEPTASSPDGFMGHWLVECMKLGTELIVIDPRKTWSASRAKYWLQVRPGTDAALALGMLHVIIEGNLYDREFVEQWTYGFDNLRERAREYPPEKVAGITWVPKEQIVAAARMYAAAKPAAIQFGVALEQSKECIPTLHALAALWAVSGNLDKPGGNVIQGNNFGAKKLMQWGEEYLSCEQAAKRIGAQDYPLLQKLNLVKGEALIDQMLTGAPYPVKATWIQGTNTFVCGAADSYRTYQAFKKTDFNVVVDLFITPTAMAFADIVLPAATYPERDGVAFNGGIATYIGAINKAIEPVGECRSDMDIVLQIGKRLDPEAWPWNNVEEMFSAMLETIGITYKELKEKHFLYDSFSYRKYEQGLLREDQKKGFNTPTGKVELYSTVLEEAGLDPLPYYEEPPESPISTPEMAKEFPLILTTGGRTPAFFHSEHRQIPSLRRINPEPLTEVHPQTAAALGIKDGDWIYLENKHGRCKQRAKLTEGIDPGVVHAQHGWWFPEKPGPEPSLYGAWESNINLLIPAGQTGRSGLGYPFKNQICRIYKAEDQ